MTQNLAVILGDQLNLKISSLKNFDPKEDNILLCEVLEEASYVKHHKKKIVFIFLFFFGLMSPLGVLLGDKIDFFTNYYTEITALIIGVFLHISTIILFESSENHKFNLQKFSAILLGILLTILTL